MSQKFLDLAGLTAYDKMLKEWFKAGVVDITDEAINALFPIPDNPYVTFIAEEDNSSIGLELLSTSQTLEYSTDTTIWDTFETTTNIFLNKGDKVYIRGILSADNTYDSDNGIYDITQFKMSGKIAASGNCNALWNYQDLNSSLKKNCGFGMFAGCASLTTAPELPATELAESCYFGMFESCTSLTVAPELPATMLAKSCYQYMFVDCTSLTTSPELLATTLSENCYAGMFSECTNLNHITCLATDISAANCTYFWVNGVASTGTFIKHPNMNSWTTGRDSIPSNWTVVDAEL
jgi:hypothetical protein